MITISLSPNTDGRDVLRSIRMLFSPWRWKKGIYEQQVSSWFLRYTQANTFFVTSGRSALSLVFAAAGIGQDDEVLLQAFTCVVVVNAISFAGATPVFVDVDASANIDPLEVEKHITKKTKAIVIQHTFGTPAQIDTLIRIAKKHHILVIEDCAHSLGATHNRKHIGTFGDAAIWSFGRDKVVSSVFGGAVTVSSPTLRDAVHHMIELTPYPNNGWIAQQLFHPIAFHLFVLPWYRIGLGKIALVCFQKLHLLSLPVSRLERRGDKPKNYSERFPNALAYLLMGQLTTLFDVTKKRNEIAAYYDSALQQMGVNMIYRTKDGSALRYGMLVDNPGKIRTSMKQRGILVGNWYHEIIDPGGDSDKKRYTLGSCPRAEYMAAHILNLPTTITQSQAEKVIKTLHQCL